MALKHKEREWLKSVGLFDDFKRIRDMNKSNGVPNHASTDDALYQVSGGDLGSPLSDGTDDIDTNTNANTNANTNTIEDAFGEIGDDSVLLIIQWVAQHIGVKDVQDSDAPNTTALALLRRCQKSPSMEDDFWNKVWVRTVPSASQRDAQRRFRDTGQKLLELNAEIRKALETQAA